MATWSEFINTEKRTSKATIGDKVTWKSGAECNFNQIVEGEVVEHEWELYGSGDKYRSRYKIIREGYEYHLLDESFLSITKKK